MPERAAPAATKADTLILVGCGQMGSAMLRGWLARDAAANFIVIEPAGLPASFGNSGNVAWHATPDGLQDDELTPDAVVFAVKPQIINDVLPPYRRWARPQTLFLSIAAGITIGGIARHLGETAIIRTMPNTPAAIGRGITVACASPRVALEQRRLCEALLAAIGESAWVEDEALLDPVTAVSGSGPAYVFLLIEALAAAGARAGLPADLALRLARETVAGSGELARLSQGDPARLREAVTSPGGTTQAALEVLMGKDGLARLIDRAVTAAAKRSRELAS
jgi:pyrroline-5-carboxylate reductase